MRQLGHNGAALIQLFEGLRLEAYLDSVGILTIGFGHTGPEVRLGMTITPQKANAYFIQDTQSACNAINACVHVPLTQNQFDALVSWAFNVGNHNAETSTLVNLLNQGHYEQVPAQLLRWNHAGGQVLAGLTARRKAEGQLWLKPDEASVSV